MKQKIKSRTGFAVGASLALMAALTSAPLSAASSPAGRDSTVVLTKEQQAVAAFVERVKEYIKRREALEEKLPKLSKESRPEDIEAHKTSFQEMVRADRAGAKQGDVLGPDIAAHIRATIRRAFKGKARAELRKTALEAETKGVPLRVNQPYPEAKELVEMPPTLLLKLPQLPKQLRYRFVGRNMLLMDRENGLILDYMLKAIP
ncbi:MAG: hypothetical protein LC802_23900 [Acidobacteria bacterium]|nr:hypothetical protein [Acidobacteriota bacterium]